METEAEYQFGQLTVLRQKNPEEYSPDQEQILQYAEYIGIELPQQVKLLYIAKEGIIAQLPQEWQACQTKSGQIVYRNKKTKIVQEEHPLDQYYRQKVQQARHNIKLPKNKIHVEENQDYLNLYKYQNDDYYDVEFELKPISVLPSIQQDKNQLNQSGVSQKMNFNQKNEQFSSNLFHDPKTKQKSKLLLSSLYSSKNNKSKIPSSISLQNNKKSSQQWSSINDLDKNVIISGSKILSDNQKDDKKQQKTSKNINLNFSNHSSNDNKIKSSVQNRVQVQFQNLSNKILPQFYIQTNSASDQQNGVVGYEQISPQMQFSDKFQVHNANPKTKLNKNLNVLDQHKRQKIKRQQNRIQNYDDKTDYIKVEVKQKQDQSVRQRLKQVLLSLQNEQQFKMQLLAQLQQNNRMKMQKIKKKMKKERILKQKQQMHKKQQKKYTKVNSQLVF